MSYQEIAQTILDSSEIRIRNTSALQTTGSLVGAFAFVSPKTVTELSLEDTGGYLDLCVEPILRPIQLADIDEWTTIFSGVILYMEVLERWFIEEPSRILKSRFAGFKVIGNRFIIEANVDDDMVGVFKARRVIGDI